MKPVLFTDFDRTLIYSKRFLDETVASTCVEEKEGKAISYMTNEALSLLYEVKQATTFIPVSTRTWETLMRVDFMKSDVPEWVICSNGGRIYHQGLLLQEWEVQMHEAYGNLQKPVTALVDVVKQAFYEFGLKDVRVYESRFLMLKFDQMTTEIKQQLEELNQVFQQIGYRIEVNSRKAYVLPDCIRKERAVAFLLEKLNVAQSISAGDSVMDLEMLRLTNDAIAPKHKTFDEEFMNITQHEGLVAGEEILYYIKRVISKK